MKFKSVISALAAAVAILAISLPVSAQQVPGPEDTTDDSTIVYPASYFAEFLPVSVNDMLYRIPGINLAMGRGGGGPGGGGGNRGRRGLGSGEGEVLINGQRITGKNSGARDMLDRISAERVDHIEIIRGTTEDIEVRGGGQVINIVLLDELSTSNTTVEIRSDRSRDGTIDTGGQLSHAGQTGNLGYLLHFEASPRYNASRSEEFSYDPDYNLREIRYEDQVRDELEYQISGNMGYRFDGQVLHLNGLFETRGESPSPRNRSIHDLVNDDIRRQREDNLSKRYSWEIGGDYERDFAGSGTYRFLFIVNDREFQFTRNRLDVVDEDKIPNLFLHNLGRDRERIARTSYTFDVAGQQGLEVGMEGAQTIRDNGLRMGLDIPGERSPAYGNLVPVSVDNSESTVEEIRYEGFAVHNWQLNPRMSLESSLLMETSTIEQSGDVLNSRDFQFVKPKVDYRFDITSSLQLRARVEKDVQQLSFSDFSASTDRDDEDQNTLAGNPEIRQEQSWRYELNLEMRLPNNLGVVNSQLWYRDLQDVIERVDVSPSPDELRSARGNIGDGKRYGLNLDVSTRLPMLGMPNALLTTGIRLQDSEIIDPFLGQKRRQPGSERWSTNVGFRNDMVEQGLTYGMFYAHSSNGGSGRTEIDIIDIEERIEQPFLMAYVEKKAFENFTFRLESRNITESEYCRKRTRFLGATVDGIVEEIEHYCNGSGMELAFRVSATF